MASVYIYDINIVVVTFMLVIKDSNRPRQSFEDLNTESYKK